VQRKRPFARCERRYLPGPVRAEIMLRQEGRCADCGTRLILGSFIFDHRPPLALRDSGVDRNDPERLVEIGRPCHEQKDTAGPEAHLENNASRRGSPGLLRQRDKVPGRPVPTRKQARKLVRAFRGVPVPERPRG
jgi:5-methylcytosine-specific restriction endonuclease McrA